MERLGLLLELARSPAARRWGRMGLVGMLASWLSLLVILAPRFSHDDAWLALLEERSGLEWLLFVAWLTALETRRRLDPAGTAALLDHGARTMAVAIALMALVASPFMNAYFTHLSHPALALAIAWTVRPWLDRVPSMRATPPPWLLPAVLFVAGAALYFVQSYRRHLWFGSGGKDLGLFHQSIWLLSRFSTPDNTVMGMNAFADHMEGIDLLAAPLQWIWPSAGSLLLFQAVVVASGVVAVVGLSRDALGSDRAAAAVGVVYLMAFDVQQAVMFDWNPTTCGAGLLPWVVWSFRRQRVAAFALTLAVVALAKENLVLYALGVCVTLSVGASRRLRRASWIAVAALAVLFVLEMKVLFPLFRADGFRHLRFEGMGTSPSEMLGTLVSSPMRAFSLLFVPGRKLDGLLVSFSTVAFACWLAPRWAWALVPPVLERFWSTHTNRWWGHHYGAGLGVLAVLACIDGLGAVRRWGDSRRLRGALGIATATVLLACLLIAGAGRYGAGPLMVWRHDYYTTPADRADARAALAVIPDDVAVAAQNHLIPHLSARREIYELTRPIRAEYVAVDFVQSAWPWDASYPRRLVQELLAQQYGVIACHGAALVLRRGAESVPCAALSPQ